MKLQNVKGSFDYLPEEQIVRNKIIRVLSNNFESFGYLPVETTTLCYYDLLASKYAGGAEILKEVYTLSDQGKRSLGLRYDLTVPFSKIISMNLNKKVSLPFRRYEIGKVYRDGPVKVGRVREFYQCDVDVCGIEGATVEAELMSLAVKCYKDLGIDIYIEWNNRKFLSGLIIEAGIEDEYVTKVILSVDKLAKIGEDGVREELKSYDIDNSKLDCLFNYFKVDFDTLASDVYDSCNDTLKEGISEVRELSKYLDDLGVRECVFTPYLARGLEIYTGTIWEVFDKEGRVTSSIGAGGRYDNIITNFINDGNKYPAVGMTFGLVPIYEIITKSNKISNNNLYDLYIIPICDEINSLKLANELREYNIRVIVEMNKRKVKKAMSWANKNNIPYVIVLGEDEIKEGKINIKNMSDGSSHEVLLNDILKMVEIIKDKGETK